jgi:hypothetical protein
VDAKPLVFRATMARSLAAYCVAVGVIAVLSSATTSGWRAVPGLATGLVVIAYAVTFAWRLDVKVNEVGVRLRNPLGSRMIPWAAVNHFEMGHGSPWRASLVLHDGSRTKTWGPGASGVRHRRSLAASQSLVDGLIDLSSCHRQGG